MPQFFKRIYGQLEFIVLDRFVISCQKGRVLGSLLHGQGVSRTLK